jgi:hypothetical protein
VVPENSSTCSSSKLTVCVLTVGQIIRQVKSKLLVERPVTVAFFTTNHTDLSLVLRRYLRNNNANGEYVDLWCDPAAARVPCVY